LQFVLANYHVSLCFISYYITAHFKATIKKLLSLSSESKVSTLKFLQTNTSSCF